MLVDVDHAERPLMPRAVRLNHQLQPRCLAGQLRHISVVVFGKQRCHHVGQVFHKLRTLFLAVYDGPARYVRQVGHDVIPLALAELLRQHHAPVLPARLVAVNLDAGERPPRQFAGNVEQHLRIAVPEVAHGLAPHLVALQSLSRRRCLCFVGLSVCGVAKAEYDGVALHGFGHASRYV